ncbi:MAG TPA: sugar phosphate isomerase/epimerase [Planctomycetota bacterium]|nr:sugar phosphate isomerase/epimerase [Planctomycetota bacterium]
MNPLTRRDFLGRSAGLAAFPLLPRALLQEFAGFNLGMESFSVRHFELGPALAFYKELGIPNAEIYADRHMPFTDDPQKLKGYRSALAEAGVTVLGFFGGGFSKNAEKARPKFAFTRAMGAKVLVGDPDPDSWDTLEALAKEYGIRFALHNHGPKSRYDTVGDVKRALEGRSENVGACVDTGHTLRSGENPVDWIKELGSRVIEVHLKDASAPNVFNVLGQGKLDVLGTLRALRSVRFDGCLALEHEEHPDNPMEDLKACMAKLRASMKEL